jgi:hypothetical protein
VKAKVRKQFFFEKKNFFYRLAPSFGEWSAQRMKVFCFFSSEKKTFLASWLVYAEAPL